MKNFLIIGLFVGTLSVSAQEIIHKNLKDSELHGKVKSVRLTTYTTVDKGGGVVDKGTVYKNADNHLIVFNEKGNIIQHNEYYPDGKLWWKASYNYEKDKNEPKPPIKKIEPKKEVKLEENTHKSLGNLRQKITYKYDRRGTLSEEITYNSQDVVLEKIIYKYDKQGNVIEQNNFQNSDKLLNKYIAKYNNNNKLTEENLFNANGELLYQATFLYNEKGYLSQKGEFFAKGFSAESNNIRNPNKSHSINEATQENWSQRHYVYDNKGNKIEENLYDFSKKSENLPTETSSITEKNDLEEEETKPMVRIPQRLLQINTFNSQGTLWKTNLYFYDEKGNIFENIEYNGRSEQTAKKGYIYDSNNKEIGYINYDSKNNVLAKYVYMYDEKGNIAEKTHYDPQGEIIKIQRSKYDAKNNEIEQHFFDSKNNLLYFYILKYDRRGNVMELDSYNPDGTLNVKNHWKYTFDTKGNWIQKIEYTSDKSYFIIERTIEYYQ
ncbi:hypothetical protein [Capnocytophaga catalasegens]|uniref:Sugar-binding protein n=1 Tax=Capnocytophaga catalasegens TaxID=1004260 RepID=A0AAV5AQY0_9FLAO|nr:hypothetical protein [Capnocytophaga catalasegens]GIZ15225.1 hypothetical protein RCZ03_12250 [Capnocytophaga catalasegens]GJM49739.1 hypothetical protein RCZ15_07140 [Capnocytophaga catalasegens]GJM52804.1 hypothetical protein RCZ16_11210 [Capnocytophaga catalasegens]